MALERFEVEEYLDAFGVLVRYQGRELVGILEDESQPTEFERVRVATRRRELLLSTLEAREIDIQQETPIDVADERGQFATYTIRGEPDERLDGFTAIILAT